MSDVIRKAFHTVVPLSFRAIASPRISGSVTMAALRGKERRLIIHRDSFVISKQSFSTVADAQKRADQKLKKLLKYKIKRLDSDIKVTRS